VWLPTNSSDFDLYQSGRGFQQSLYHAIELAAVAPNLTNKKVAILVSPQWFSRGGIKAGAFESVFSYAAWNAMLANRHLSASTRQRLIARVGELMPQVCSVGASCATTTLGTVQEVINLPYAAFAQRVNELRDTYHGTDYRKAVAYTGAWQPGKQAMATIDWVSEQAKASAMGKSRVTNRYGLDNSYYAKRILPYLPKLKGHESNVTYTTSSEYDDLQLFLDVAHDLGIDVMLVSLPVNGLWSDYTGLPRAERDGFATKIRSIASANNARLTDLTVNAYAPYYFYDTIHLGWRGWLDVTRACWDFART
jgi:D-alanine transfer protein